MAQILIADDVLVMKRNIRKILEKEGYQIVAEATNGKQAYLEYKNYVPDLVTMDVNMPIVDGVEAVGNIVNEFCHAKIIIISSNDQILTGPVHSKSYRLYLVLIVELLSKQEEQSEFLKEILRTIFNSQDLDDIKMYLSLLPEEIKVIDKYIDLNFKLISESIKEAGSREIMLVLTDISDKKELESKVEEERNSLKMAVNVVVNFNDFIELKNSYLDFFNRRVEEMIASGMSIQDLLSRIYLQIHNFKGDFSQLGMNNTVNSLHCFEGKLLELKAKGDEESIGLTEIRRLIKEEKVIRFLNQDLDILQELLGDYMFKQDKKVIIEIDKLKMIEKRVVELLAPKDSEKLLVELKSLRYKPFKEI